MIYTCNRKPPKLNHQVNQKNVSCDICLEMAKTRQKLAFWGAYHKTKHRNCVIYFPVFNQNIVHTQVWSAQYTSYICTSCNLCIMIIHPFCLSISSPFCFFSWYQCPLSLMLPWLLFISTYIIDTMAKLIQLDWLNCCYLHLQNPEVIGDTWCLLLSIGVTMLHHNFCWGLTRYLHLPISRFHWNFRDCQCHPRETQVGHPKAVRFTVGMVARKRSPNSCIIRPNPDPKNAPILFANHEKTPWYLKILNITPLHLIPSRIYPNMLDPLPNISLEPKWPLFCLEFRPCFEGLTFKNRGHWGSRSQYAQWFTPNPRPAGSTAWFFRIPWTWAPWDLRLENRRVFSGSSLALQQKYKPDETDNYLSKPKLTKPDLNLI